MNSLLFILRRNNKIYCYFFGLLTKTEDVNLRVSDFYAGEFWNEHHRNLRA